MVRLALVGFSHRDRRVCRRTGRPSQDSRRERASHATPQWTLPDARDVELGGPLGDAFRQGVRRLGEDPYRSVVFLRSDLTFE